MILILWTHWFVAVVLVKLVLPKKKKKKKIPQARIWLSFWRLAQRKLSVCVQGTHFTFLNIIQFLWKGFFPNT